MIHAAMLLAALALDLVLGEPPAAAHPVVWIGKLVSALERLAPRGTIPARCLPTSGAHGYEDVGQEVIPAPVTAVRYDLAQMAYGAFMPLVGLLAFVLPAWLLLGFLWQASLPAYFVVGVVLLKSTFSVRELIRAALRVRQALVEGRLDGARAQLSGLVSRDTRSLDESLVVAATVESVAENSHDSFVAPVFYYLLFGVPGALAYRVINTFDSMVGYRGHYEYLGKVPARLDDLANFVPARLAGLLLVGASFLKGLEPRRAWQTMWRFHGATESPNAGWPMSAMAGALAVRLVKEGHYSLGDADSPLSRDKIDRAIDVVFVAIIVMATLAVLVEVVKHGHFS